MIIKTADLKTLDKNIASLFCNEIAHCKLSRFCNKVVCVCLCVCECVFACAFISFYRKWLFLSKLMSGANINVQFSGIYVADICWLIYAKFPSSSFASRKFQNSDSAPNRNKNNIRFVMPLEQWMNGYILIQVKCKSAFHWYRFVTKRCER